MQRYAVWYGASLLGLSDGFADTGEGTGRELTRAALVSKKTGGRLLLWGHRLAAIACAGTLPLGQKPLRQSLWRLAIELLSTHAARTAVLSCRPSCAHPTCL